MAAFPPTLLVSRGGYNAEVSGFAHESEIAGGVYFQATDYDSSASTVNVSIVTGTVGKNTFKSFYDVDIFDGSAKFTIDLDLGAGVESRVAQIISSPTYSGDGDPKWNISMTLEVEDMASTGA